MEWAEDTIGPGGFFIGKIIFLVPGHESFINFKDFSIGNIQYYYYHLYIYILNPHLFIVIVIFIIIIIIIIIINVLKTMINHP